MESAIVQTERRAVEAVPRAEDLGIGFLFWHMPDAVVVGEATSGRIVLWNPAAEALFGYAADEAIGRSLEVLVPPDLRPRHRAGLAAYAATGRGPLVDAARPVEVPARRKTGEEITVELSLTPISGVRVSGCYVAAFIRDATERARVATERAALLAAAEGYARRLEELAALKADFTTMVAHELGNPIAAIRGLADLLTVDGLDATTRSALAVTIRTEAELLQRLVGDVRAAAAAERDDFTVRPRPVRLHLLLADAVAFARSLPGDHPVTSDLRVNEWVLADPERIAQVLHNLLNNAAKYTPAGTTIALRAWRDDCRVQVEVVDRGPGISPEDLERIFAKFGRGRDAEGQRVPGLGVGLYLSRRIVQAHGSELTVSSTSGVGSTFGFSSEVAG